MKVLGYINLRTLEFKRNTKRFPFDDLDFDMEEIESMTIEQLAERYSRYMKLSQWYEKKKRKRKSLIEAMEIMEKVAKQKYDFEEFKKLALDQSLR